MSRRRRIVEVLDASAMARLEERMFANLSSLSEREVGIVRLRYGFTDGDPKTFDEIAQLYGVSTQRIRAILKNTMSTLDLDCQRGNVSPT